MINLATIEEAFEFVRNGASIKQQDGAVGIPITRIETIWNATIDDKRFGYANIEHIGEYENYLLEDGDILMSHINSPKHLGKCAIYRSKPKTLIHGMNLLNLRAKKNILVPQFGFYYLSSNGFKEAIIKISNQSVNQASFSTTNLKKLKIPLPSLAEQQKIAAILDAADSLRQKDQQLVEHYTALSQSLFLEMFGDPVTNPMGWNIEAFDKLVASDCPLTYGIVQPGDELTEGTAIVRPVDLVERYIKINSLKKIAPEISQKFERTILKGGELLLSVRGSVGAMSIALPELRGANVTRGIVPIWMNTEKMTNEFAINLLQSNQVQKKLKDSSKGATLVQLNLKDLREMQLICPPIVLQKTFTERIQLIEAQKQQALRSLEKSKALFNSLLQRAFTGELTAMMAA